MARLNVNPTRMELKRLKIRLITARRGHKLLKDKRDEMMKRFLDIVRRNRQVRASVEAALTRAQKSFNLAFAVISPEMSEQALMYPKQKIFPEITFKNIMSVDVPVYEFRREELGASGIYPYGFTMTSGELDDALRELYAILPEMLELAALEKSAQLLAQEIEKSRRRVNALEYVMIPQLEESIQYITMKLEENERGNLSRLMKVKDIMIKEQIEKNRAQHSK